MFLIKGNDCEVSNGSPSQTRLRNRFTRRELLQAAGLGASFFGMKSWGSHLEEQDAEPKPIPSLLPRETDGHQFVVYGDCCSGIPGTPNEKNFAAVNRMLARLRPQPEFFCFLGDDVLGTKDYEALRRQWYYWLNTEMAWLDRKTIPMMHTTSNHNTFDEQSEQVWREVFPDIPQNGPAGQEGLSYYIRRNNLLLVAVNTNYSGLGQGHVETHWLDRVLTKNADAVHKFVLGHFPAHPVNGYELYPEWRIVPQDAEEFWKVLVRHRVHAYLCSHILAFDVQVHQGVLQILTGGAGDNFGPGGFMPGRTEYFHAVQMAVDSYGLRYQVLDAHGVSREWLEWPLSALPANQWEPLERGKKIKLQSLLCERPGKLSSLTVYRFSGILRDGSVDGKAQTLICGWDPDEGPATIWLGLEGMPARLIVRLVPEPGGGEQIWEGPLFTPGEAIDFQVGIHTGMGPGGILYRREDSSPWSSLKSSSAKGAEGLSWPGNWVVGQGPNGPSDRPFLGTALTAAWAKRTLLSPSPGPL